MAISNKERVGRALELVEQGLRPYVEQQLTTHLGEGWKGKMQGFQGREAEHPVAQWDAQRLLKVITGNWSLVFGKTLGKAEKGYAEELIGIRNDWAHAKRDQWSSDDTERALDTAKRLLEATGAEEAAVVDKMRTELRALLLTEQTRRETRKVNLELTFGSSPESLQPWRTLVRPHADVLTGKFTLAEFAADLAQVVRGDAREEYADAHEFFRRTYMTEGLTTLLTEALNRLSGRGGDPVVKLLTNFGGGKTHSMLALYHLFAPNVASSALLGVEDLLSSLKLAAAPKANRAVLVGTALSAGKGRDLGDGVTAHTLWGHLGYQLLGKKGYAMVATHDASGISPGSDDLVPLLKAASPCIILIDEWVAYLRNTGANAPGGSFEANLTFAQALTEAVKAVPTAMLVASLPQSEIETGGERGQEAHARLVQTFGRTESNWRPATMVEGFEIVRRRLFEPTDPALKAKQSAVVKSFIEMYRNNRSEFPAEASAPDYEALMERSYPFHPELFQRLYDDWGSLEKFQRTRGVLRLMAQVIHHLYDNNDASLLITPATIPVHVNEVQNEMMKYLDDNWRPVIEHDVDGAKALSVQLDNEKSNFGRYGAARRVARTVFMGSAPTVRAAHKGVDAGRVKLGCVQPGETAATFGDALRTLASSATYLYQDAQQYWFSTQPTVTRLALDRAAQALEKREKIDEQIEAWLKEDARKKGSFEKVRVAPAGPHEVGDEPEAQLVILGPTHRHAKNDEASPAIVEAKKLLDSCGNRARSFQNAIVFLAPDVKIAQDLDNAVAKFLAWNSILDDKVALNLDQQQITRAEQQRKESETDARNKLFEAYKWVIAPRQATPSSPIGWDSAPISVGDKLAERAFTKLRQQGLITDKLGYQPLRKRLDEVPLWRSGLEHVEAEALPEYYAKFLYLDRLTNPANVVEAALQDGLNVLSWESEAFAWAGSYDAKRGRYVDLVLPPGRGRSDSGLMRGLLVKSEAARRQAELEKAERAQPGTSAPVDTTGEPRVLQPDGESSATVRGDAASKASPAAPARPRYRRFHGTAELGAERPAVRAGQIAEEIVTHLASIGGAEIRVSIEISAEFDSDVSEQVLRTVRENARTLRVDGDFEED